MRKVEDRQDRLGELLVAGEPARDRGVIRARSCERSRCEGATCLEVDIAVGAKLLEHRVEVLGPAERHDKGVVLRGCPQHRGAADVDLLDRIGPLDVESADRALEGIQVDVDEVDRRDPVLGEIGDVGVDVAPREDAAVDAGVQRDDAMTEHLGHPRELGDRGHGDLVIGNQLGGAAARDELDPEPVELLREGEDARLVGG